MLIFVFCKSITKVQAKRTRKKNRNALIQSNTHEVVIVLHVQEAFREHGPDVLAQ